MTFREPGIEFDDDMPENITPSGEVREYGPRTSDGGNDEPEETADGEPYDPLTDPANARVIAALREFGRHTPPPIHEDKVVAMLRAKGLWKPEYDEQPTPTTEPPRIEDMAPGTTFTATVHESEFGGVVGSRTRRFFVAPEWLYDDRGLDWFFSAVDPSTIRDVQPPAVTP